MRKRFGLTDTIIHSVPSWKRQSEDVCLVTSMAAPWLTLVNFFIARSVLLGINILFGESRLRLCDICVCFDQLAPLVSFPRDCEKVFVRLCLAHLAVTTLFDSSLTTTVSICLTVAGLASCFNLLTNGLIDFGMRTGGCRLSYNPRCSSCVSKIDSTHGANPYTCFEVTNATGCNLFVIPLQRDFAGILRLFSVESQPDPPTVASTPLHTPLNLAQ